MTISPISPVLRPLLAVYSPEFVQGIAYVVHKDPSLTTVALNEQFPSFEVDANGDYKTQRTSLEYLVRSVVGQQLSGRAAEAIHKKFCAVYNNGGSITPTAEQILESDTEVLRTAGLSYRKIEYIKGIAEAFESGQLSEESLKQADIHDVVDTIVSLKGIGPWTADMYLLFCLRNLDVLSIGDLGVLKGFENYLRDRPELQQELKTVDWTSDFSKNNPGKSAKALNRKPATLSSPKKETGVPLYKKLEYVADRFRPYRSVFQLFLWKLAGTETAVISADKEGEEKSEKNSAKNGAKKGGKKSDETGIEDGELKTKAKAKAKARTTKRTESISDTGNIEDLPELPDALSGVLPLKRSASPSPTPESRPKRRRSARLASSS